MFTPAVVPYISQFCPLGHTPAVSLTRGLPQGSPADILLLECGDVRNILYTAYTERGFPPRRLDITCCDAEPSILARNIILFTLLIDGISTDDAWDIYFHLVIGEGLRRTVKGQAAKLLEISNSLQDWNQGTYGSVLHFCDDGSLHLVKEVWSKYAAPDSKSCSLAQLMKHLRDTQEFLQSPRKRTDTADVENGSRSTAPLAVASGDHVLQSHKHFGEHGTFSVLSSPLPNPLFAETLSQNLHIHCGTNPILGFHLATAFATLAPASPLNPDSGKDGFWRMVDAARVQFREWTSAFQDISKSLLLLRFVVADALSFSHVLQYTSVKDGTTANIYRRMLDSSPLILDAGSYGDNGSAPTSFDVIDTSNLVDRIGALNILVASAPLLKDATRSILYTETLFESLETYEDQLGDLLSGHSPTISLLIGVSPAEYWTNTTSISCVDELLINAKLSHQQGVQAHSRIAWKLSKYFLQERSVSTAITAQAPGLARIIFLVYHTMFTNEYATNLLEMSRNELLEKAGYPAHAVYHRGSFAAFMKCVQRNISTDWPVFWERLEFFNKSLGAHPESVRSHFGQEMGVQLYLHGVYKEDWLQVRSRSNINTGCFHCWEDIPDLLCITIVVPRKDIEHLYSTVSSKLTAPNLNIALKAPGWENFYASIQMAFGDIETSGVSSSDAFSVSIRPDPRGWQGKSPMIVSFFAPTNVILQENFKDVQIGLIVQPELPIMASFSHLNPGLTVYTTTLLDRNNVFFTKYMPGMSGYPAMGSRNSTISPREANQDDTFRTSIYLNFEDDRIKTIGCRVDFLSAESRKLLKEISVVLRQSSPSSLELVFGMGLWVCPIYFPVPVWSDQAISKFSRTLGAVEMVVSPADPIVSQSLSFFVYPVSIDEQSLPIIFNGNHVNLDSLPILSVDDRNKKANQWLVTLASLQFSLRERRLRKFGTPQTLRLNFKESIFTMFMLSSGLQGGNTGLFALSHPKDGNQLLLFVRAIRIDGAAGSVVLDAAALPLTHKLIESGEIGDFLLVLRELQLCSIDVDDEELILWKKVLPAFAERCRTWSHGPDCEYKKPGATIPLSEKPGEQSICTCSNGTLPDQFMNIPEWEEVSKYMVRVAISLTFSVPFVENIVDPEELELEGLVENLATDRCRYCNATKSKDGKKLRKCTACRDAVYCSVECQKKDWKTHRMECKS
ncbi:MYND finger [Biscogniauxia sp. FL1348]|nr:MYND finger [Biscogniauxia sp. FL1348]